MERSRLARRGQSCMGASILYPGEIFQEKSRIPFHGRSRSSLRWDHERAVHFHGNTALQQFYRDHQEPFIRFDEIKDPFYLG